MKLRLTFSCCMVAIAAAMTGCGAIGGGYNLPPASRLMEPGPGVGGPGPGVIRMPTPGIQPGPMQPGSMRPGPMQQGPMQLGSMRPGPMQQGPMRPGPMQQGPVRQASYCSPVMGGVAVGGGAVTPAMEVQVLFARPEAMQVSFDAGGAYDSTPIITPGRQNFMQGGLYRLKVTGVPGREGIELYPTLEVGPPTRQTAAYLAHNAIPVQFTEEDFDQVLSGNFVTKVIYLPEPDFQELALAGVETLVSTRLDPGLDPIVEADRRGAILAVVRIGNKDMEIPGAVNVSPTYGAQRGTGVAPVGYGAAVDTAVAPIATSAQTGGVAQSSYGCQSCGGRACPPGGCLSGSNGQDFYGPNSTPRGGFGPGGLPPGLAAGGQYGLPITGTPIGLPGPPHVPLGVPAGLKKHVMHNWTHRSIPDPVSKLKINVKQRPGLSYPQPPNRAWVVEDTIHSAPHFKHGHAPGACPDGSCGPGKSGGLLGGLFGH